MKFFVIFSWDVVWRRFLTQQLDQTEHEIWPVDMGEGMQMIMGKRHVRQAYKKHCIKQFSAHSPKSKEEMIVVIDCSSKELLHSFLDMGYKKVIYFSLPKNRCGREEEYELVLKEGDNLISRLRNSVNAVTARS